jgi:hypothetical protein
MKKLLVLSCTGLSLMSFALFNVSWTSTCGTSQSASFPDNYTVDQIKTYMQYNNYYNCGVYVPKSNIVLIDLNG